MKVQCELCPKHCIISPGQSGNCRIRVNIDNKLVATTYGFPCSAHIDPIEKKPLFHFLPGTKVFSIATAGCNLHCKNCQNWGISQRFPTEVPAYDMPPEKVTKLTNNYNCKTTAYTYSDPVAFYEYTFDSAIENKKHGLKNVLVTAGYINQKPLIELCKYIDGVNLDLKSMSNKFYEDVCGATLNPVLETAKTLKSEGVLLEVTNLLLPTLNDDEQDIKKLCKWIYSNLGKEVPLHFSRFFPNYKMRNLPPTSLETLKNARNMAKDIGLNHVYVGNVVGKGWENTYCPDCSKLLIDRYGYKIRSNKMKKGACPACGKDIYGVWN